MLKFINWLKGCLALVARALVFHISDALKACKIFALFAGGTLLYDALTVDASKVTNLLVHQLLILGVSTFHDNLVYS